MEMQENDLQRSEEEAHDRSCRERGKNRRGAEGDRGGIRGEAYAEYSSHRTSARSRADPNRKPGGLRRLSIAGPCPGGGRTSRSAWQHGSVMGADGVCGTYLHRG